MWLTIILQAFFFCLTHFPELIEVIRALLAFFKAHKRNPEMSNWMIEFPLVLKECEETGDPKPLQEFLDKIRETIKESK